ncbi:MAG: MarR family winged helix-turn-helix transcriptional regulator [Trueperaceae bacterium]
MTDTPREPHAPTDDAPRSDANERDALLARLAQQAFPLMWTLRQAAVRALEPLGLSPVKGLMLGLAAAAPRTPGELSELLETAAPAVSVMLSDLEKRGLIRRDPDPADRRRVRIAATDAGHATVARMTEQWIDASRTTVRGLSDHDLRELIRMYEHVTGAGP